MCLYMYLKNWVVFLRHNLVDRTDVILPPRILGRNILRNDYDDGS